MASAYERKGDLTNAEKYYKIALEIQEQDMKNINRTVRIYSTLAKIAHQKGDDKNAYAYLEKYRISNDLNENMNFYIAF